MSELLPRGWSAGGTSRVSYTISEGPGYSLYATNGSLKVLALTNEFHAGLLEKGYILPGLFSPAEGHDCMVFTSNELIAVLDKGPGPSTYSEIKNFSAAFRSFRNSNPEAGLSGAVYIEHHALLLPVEGGEQKPDDIIVGNFLSDGVDVSCEDFTRLSGLMRWIDPRLLENAMEPAGFKLKKSLRSGAEQRSAADIPDDAALKSSIPDEPFSLPGRPALEQFFRDNIIDIVRHREEYSRMGISFPGATILCGPPGCGKTFAVEKLIEYLGWKSFRVDSGSIGSSYIHETGRKISQLFDEAEAAAPSVLIIDEMEAFLSQRGSSDSSTHHNEELAEFLRRIPEAPKHGVLVFAMTNMLSAVDPAIKRKGRFEHIIEVSMASAGEIESMLNHQLKSLPVGEDVDIPAIARALEGRPLSDVSFVLREAGRRAVKSGLKFMNMACFDSVIASLAPQKTERKIGF